MKTVYDTNVVLTCTDNGKEAPAIIDNFRENKSFDVFLATSIGWHESYTQSTPMIYPF